MSTSAEAIGGATDRRLVAASSCQGASRSATASDIPGTVREPAMSSTSTRTSPEARSAAYMLRAELTSAVRVPASATKALYAALLRSLTASRTARSTSGTLPN